MTLLLTEQFSGLEGALGQTNILYDEQGTSWSAVNASLQVLFCWIATISSNDVVVGRVDGRGVTDDTIVSPKTLGTNSGAEGVRCCYNPSTGGWIILYNVGTILYYKTFSQLLVATSSDIKLRAIPSGSDSSTYNLGCDNSGKMYVSWPGWLIKLDPGSGALDFDREIQGGNRIHVHVRSGYVDVTRININNIVIDRYDENMTFLYSISAATSTTLDTKLHSITSRYGHEGAIVAFIDGTSGDNVKYRAFDETGYPLYTTKTLSGTGHVDISSNQGRLHLDIGQITGIDDQYHTFAIRAVSRNSGSNRVIALIEPQNFNPSIIDSEEFINITDSDARYGESVSAVSQFELRFLKPNFVSTPSMDMEVYVRQSIWMSLWRIETTARVFYHSSYETVAKNDVEYTYINYPSGTKLAGDTCTTDACYIATTGRSGVNPDTTAFSAYWGTATTEDNIFLGGPVLNDISYSFENNPNMFDPQMSALASDLGVSAFEYFITGRAMGWGFGTDTPEIRITINSVPYVLQRHVMDSSLWYQASNPSIPMSVDYAIIIRLPLATSSIQSDRSHIYIAGINGNGTRAAAYVYKNALTYKLGSSSAQLISIEYPQSIGDTSPWTDYIAGTTGNIHVYPLKIAVADNFEGIR